ncbi:HXXEE domain-containing protein [Calothrix sp. FACHB-1219]|uniref:HXXEE domain-containing protein n=1 Tax=unclassified Calothrix TaxID=2619626 RepID=UPI001683959C|nr:MULTISPECIES: HXXEE domain-containing protein [unclassified Calothrix]MBD2207792.1 HXXEE domain-containing protein [Calothrix sp. FACHB-168]MBD2222412.1 HXXEE domain-containing protein [Calothrix sp. FACHB-1219]
MLDSQPTKIAYSYWILGLIQAFHSMEETYTKLYSYFGSISEALHQYLPWIPVFEISADLFAILNYLIIALMLGSMPSAEKETQWGWYFMCTWAIIELLNGTFHICTWLFLHQYFPGGVTGSVLFVVSIIFIQKLRTVSSKKVVVDCKTDHKMVNAGIEKKSA